MSLYLNVPYSEKDEAKALGARWNPRVKKWYTEGGWQDYGKFAKWIYGLRGGAIIATEYIHVIEGRQSCWKCGKPTKVIGLGIGEYVHLYEEGTEGEELVQRMGSLKILGIPIEDDLVLNWNMGWSSNDYAYLK